jgi:hypothetical protein
MKMKILQCFSREKCEAQPLQKPSKTVSCNTHIEIVQLPSRSVSWNTHVEVFVIPYVRET